MGGRSSSGQIREDGAGQAPNAQRMELKYCERCGALGVQPAGRAGLQQDAAGMGCGACRESLQWLAGGVQR